MHAADGDPFEAEYAAGVLRADPPPQRAVAGAGDVGADAARADEIALAGCVLTSERVLNRGYVHLGGSAVVDVTGTAPAGVPVLETGGVILPGLIDLHGHPEYNVFAPWEPPRTFPNRGEWRASPEYGRLVKAPYGALKAAGIGPQLTRYAELRALVGGVTAVQGSAVDPEVLEESLVRNVDRRIFGGHRARSIVFLDFVGAAEHRTLLDDLARGEVDAVYIHLAEGVDDASRQEFELLKDMQLLVAQTVIIHGTALSEAQLLELADAGGKLVWSPQSNLRLYAATTHAMRARELGIPLGLGADWVPSGSLSTLDELRVARRQLAAQGAPDDPRALVGMVTWDAARIAGLGDRLGDLRPGLAADVCVLERCHPDPWESVLRADRSAVQAVLIGGHPVYARSDWFGQLADVSEAERVWAWGREMTLDTSYATRPGSERPPRLSELRSAILDAYLGAGPIFA